ncbi:Uncharacterised protein [Mycobacterium tuberculosis]|nr:Uncharacterised protein [Mycobacterium tuberculosis]
MLGCVGRHGRVVVHRRPPRQADVPAAADEDGVGRIVVRYPDRSKLLCPDGRPAKQLRQPHPCHRSALCVAVPRRGPDQRCDVAGYPRSAAGIPAALRTKRLPAQPLRHLLVISHDDRVDGDPGAVRTDCALAHPWRPDPQSTLVLLAGAANHARPVPGQQRRMGVHRDGAPALGRRP